MRFSTTPTPRPTRQATMAEVKRANRAAASAGMTSSGTVVGSREVSDPASTPRMPTTSEARRVLAMASPLGDRPASTPDTSLSAVARVARPNLVKRYSRVSAMATRTAAPATMRPDSGTPTPATLMLPAGSRDGSLTGWAPNHSVNPAARKSRMPSDATSLATGAADRSRRNASTSMSAPSTRPVTRASGTAIHLPTRKPNSPLVKPQNAYPATMAWAPMARLMMPDPRYIT